MPLAGALREFNLVSKSLLYSLYSTQWCHCFYAKRCRHHGVCAEIVHRGLRAYRFSISWSRPAVKDCSSAVLHDSCTLNSAGCSQLELANRTSEQLISTSRSCQSLLPNMHPAGNLDETSNKMSYLQGLQATAKLHTTSCHRAYPRLCSSGSPFSSIDPIQVM